MYKRILMAYNGSHSGQRALLDCHEIAQWSHAELTLISVKPLPLSLIGPEFNVHDEELFGATDTHYQQILDAGVRRLSDSGVKAHGELVTGDPVIEIVRCAVRTNAELIIVGHRHLDGWVSRWWRGSVSKSLIESSHCSVLIVMTH